VLAPRSSIWKGLVILVIPNGGYVYNQNIRVGRVSDRLTMEGYMVQRVYVPAVNSRIYDFFRKRLSGGMKLPDLFVFVDEYRAMGGALALYEAGVRIPEDVKIVSVANVGNGPVLRSGVARIEFDPFKHGDGMGDAIVKYLSSGKPPDDAEYLPRYIPDATFPA